MFIKQIGQQKNSSFGCTFLWDGKVRSIIQPQISRLTTCKANFYSMTRIRASRVTSEVNAMMYSLVRHRAAYEMERLVNIMEILLIWLGHDMLVIS